MKFSLYDAWSEKHGLSNDEGYVTQPVANPWAGSCSCRPIGNSIPHSLPVESGSEPQRDACITSTLRMGGEDGPRKDELGMVARIQPILGLLEFSLY